MNELSLFSGYGGFLLGLRLAGLPVRTVGYVEIEPYCQEIIKARIKDGYLDDAPIFPDIRAFDGRQYRGLVDIITAGFPCQPHARGGLQRGAEDPRDLWPDTIRAIRTVGPRYVLLENSLGLLSGYLGSVLRDLAGVGLAARWCLVSACSVGAPHTRDRLENHSCYHLAWLYQVLPKFTSLLNCARLLAGTVGFEPTNPGGAKRFLRPPHSATLARARK